MAGGPYHLGWFTDCYRAPSWNTRWEGTSSRDWASDSGFYVDLARAVERAKFDFMMFADGSYIPDAYGGSTEAYLRLGTSTPRLDPTVIMPIIAHSTSRLGLASTLTTTEWRPFQLARHMASLDHISNGRAGWNIVTGSSPRAAQNYGFDDQPSHDVRYDMADEFVEIATRLWDSWEPDALVMDRESGYYVDHTKVHTIDYAGKYFRSRGPATTLRPPQGRPVLMQAGSSGRGRQFAARHADVVLSTAESISGFKAYRDDVREAAAAQGRDPGDVKVMGLFRPVLGDTDEMAQQRAELRDAESQLMFEHNIMMMSHHWNIDLSTFDLDQPLSSELETNGHAGLLDSAVASGKTLRQLFDGAMFSRNEDFPLIGTPDTVAGQLGEMMQEIGGDGIVFNALYLDRRYISEVVDGLVPVMQRRGLCREEYTTTHFRDHLSEF